MLQKGKLEVSPGVVRTLPPVLAGDRRREGIRDVDLPALKTYLKKKKKTSCNNTEKHISGARKRKPEE